MAFTATINSITPSSDGNNGVNWISVVTFADTASGFSSVKTYLFPMGTSQTSAVATITADGNSLKSALATASTLQAKVGSVIII